MERGLRLHYPPETPVGGFIVFVREKAPFAKVLTSRGRVPRLSVSVRVCVCVTRMQIVPPVSVSWLYLDKRGLTRQLHAAAARRGDKLRRCEFSLYASAWSFFLFFLKAPANIFFQIPDFFGLFLRCYLKPEHNSVC